MNLSIPENETWRAVAELLNSESDPPGLQRCFPEDHRSLSLLAGLTDANVAVGTTQATAGQELHADLGRLLDRLNVFESISRCPILAITGMLNAGKSSLLATYLSPSNRRRVLRGLGNDSGTHRFVVWLPDLWRQEPELLSTLISFLSSLFGHPPEQLADDPEKAALQYNGHVIQSSLLGEGSLKDADPQSIPLLAFDEGLNELKLGLVDCPDIQTGFFGTNSRVGSPLADQRRGYLAQIGRLCSAFIVVSKMGSLHDEGLLQIMTTLRDAMPGVPRLLAINKVKARYSPETVFEEARGLVERFGISGMFTAYDFRSALAASRIPPNPASLIPNEDGEPQPLFFEVGKDLKQTRYLIDLGEQLDVGTLARESSRSLVLQLKSKTLSAIEWIEKNQQLRDQQICDGWQAVADACYDFMAERDSAGKTVGLRLQASPAIVAQMADSLRRTAPLWMQFSLSIDRTARQLQQAVANSASRFKILQSASDSVTSFAKRFRRGEGAQVVTPERLAEAIRNRDMHTALDRIDQETLTSRCELAMKRFAAEDKALLDTEQLDEWSRRVWKEMSIKQKIWKGTQPLAVITAPLLAVVLVPFDGGGSAVLVFASAKELLAAAGIAALVGPLATGGEALNIVQRETPWRQLSDLFAIVCDSIGLPRPQLEQLPSSKCAGQMRRLLKSNLESKTLPEPTVVEMWKASPELLDELRIHAKQLSN